MKRKYPNEFLFSAVALLLIVIAVQSMYAMWIRPTANAMLTEQHTHSADPTYTPQRSL